MNPSPKVTVVIPCYNDKEYIVATVDSILQQTFPDFEVIIVDDGSDIETKKILQQLNLPKVRVITQENKGPSAARNAGIKEANSEFILMIDGDDICANNFLELAIPILEQEDSIGAVSSYCTMFTGAMQKLYEHCPKGGNLSDFLLDNNSVSFALFRKKCWEVVGGYDEKMLHGFEDWEFWIGVTKNGWSIKVIPDFLFFYRQKPNSKSLDKISKQLYRESNLQYIFKKHKEVYASQFDQVIDYWAELAHRNKKNELKYKNALEFKIGHTVLFPLRFLKRIFKVSS